MRVCVFEQWEGGHYFDFLECIVPALAELAEEVVVSVTARAFGSDLFAEQLGFCRELPRVRFDPTVPALDPRMPASQRIAVFRNVQEAVRRSRADFLLVPSADGSTLAAGLLGATPLGALPGRIPADATFHYGYGFAATTAKRRFKDLLYRSSYVTAPWTQLNFVNCLTVESAARAGESWVRRARVHPNPTPRVERIGAVEARKALGIPEDGRYAGVVGSLDPRKAIPELLAAFRGARLRETDRLLLAGACEPGYAALIAREYADLVKSDRLIVLDRFLTSKELDVGYRALDLSCLVYRESPNLSGLMLRSLSAGRPVVSHDEGWPRAIVKRFKVGACCPVTDVPALSRTLANAFETSQGYVEEPAVHSLLQYNSIPNFQNTMLTNVAAAMGRTPGPLLPWHAVLETLPPERRSLY